MLLFRALALLFAAGIFVCVAAYFITGNRRYLGWAGLLFKLALAAGLLFFAVLILERAVLAL
jgi:hypothetical protein